jgi:hypothetical protein
VAERFVCAVERCALQKSPERFQKASARRTLRIGGREKRRQASAAEEIFARCGKTDQRAQLAATFTEFLFFSTLGSVAIFLKDLRGFVAPAPAPAFLL